MNLRELITYHPIIIILLIIYFKTITSRLNLLTENSCPDSSQYSCESQQSSSLVESLKILQQHGITMLPSEDHSILSSAVESGHSVVLTEVGKEVLNSMKTAERNDLSNVHYSKPTQNESKKYVTITPEEFLSLTSSAISVNSSKHLNNGKSKQNVKNHVKRVVMKKNKIRPIPQSNNVC